MNKKLVVFVKFLVILVKSSHSISNSDKAVQVIYNLTNFAISRQNYGHHLPPKPQYGSYQYPPRPPQYPQQYYPQLYRPSSYGPQYNQQGVMDVLSSIALNDKLRCVPRLLCEVTSNTVSARQKFQLPKLPFSINMESIMGLLSIIDVASVSPIPIFAKAAFLGYISKGNSDSCLSAYPTCPKDPDRLVQYLNNYNGGFFRFFNGVRPHPANYGLYSPNFSKSQRYPAQQRIQNKPVDYVSSPNDGIIFPNRGDNVRSPKTLTFPSQDLESGHNDYRKPKELPFTINHYYSSNELDFQRPLPNHKATPMIFPDRTGTGDLRLDHEELSNEQHYNLQYNNVINFNPAVSSTNEAYAGSEGVANGGLFSFPAQ